MPKVLRHSSGNNNILICWRIKKYKLPFNLSDVECILPFHLYDHFSFIDFFFQILAAILTQMTYRRGHHTSVVLFFYWFISLICGSFSFVSQINYVNYLVCLFLLFCFFVVVFFMYSGATLIRTLW